MPRREKNDLAQLARVARHQLTRAQLLGKTLDAIAEAARDVDLLWQPDDQWRADFKEVTATISQCGAALTKALEANEKALQRASDGQLEKAFKQELLKMAETFSPEEWAILDNARARQQKYKERGTPWAATNAASEKKRRGRPPKYPTTGDD